MNKWSILFFIGIGIGISSIGMLIISLGWAFPLIAMLGVGITVYADFRERQNMQSDKPNPTTDKYGMQA